MLIFPGVFTTKVILTYRDIFEVLFAKYYRYLMKCKYWLQVWEASWNQCHFRNLPRWLQDNDFLHAGHRPPLPSFYACFKSIFRIHTETGNIWTHLLGNYTV